MWSVKPVLTKGNSTKMVVILRGLMFSIYYSFKRKFQVYLNAVVLPAMLSLIASLYLTPVVNFILCSLEHLASACSITMFYRRTGESIVTGSSAAQRTLSFSTHTDNIACWMTCWLLSLCSVLCSLWSLLPCSVQCSLWSLSLWSVQCSLWSLSLCFLPPLCSGNERPRSSYSLTMQQPLTSAISTQCCTQDPTFNVNCH
jgi:hypothetical protein